MRLLLIMERIKLNKTQKQIAEAIGITSQMLSKYELDKIQPSYRNMKKISEYYGLPVDILFAEEQTSEDRKEMNQENE